MGFGGGADGFSHEQTGQTANYDEGGPLVPPTPGGGFVDMDGDVEEKKPKKKKALLKGLFHRMEKNRRYRKKFHFHRNATNAAGNATNAAGNATTETGRISGRILQMREAGIIRQKKTEKHILHQGKASEDPEEVMSQIRRQVLERTREEAMSREGRGYEPDPAPGFERHREEAMSQIRRQASERHREEAMSQIRRQASERHREEAMSQIRRQVLERTREEVMNQIRRQVLERDPAGGYEPDPTPGFWDKPAGGYNPDPMPGNDGAQGRGYTPNPGTGFASDDDDGNDATVMLRDDGSEATILLKARVKPNATLIRLHTQEKFHITTEICKIGKRALMVDICIRNNPTISREHCAIHFEEGKYYLEDKDSSNYTYLNGNRAMPGQKLLLNDGDQIRLSDEEFIFRKGDVK